jgi:hypothetical protein
MVGSDGLREFQIFFIRCKKAQFDTPGDGNPPKNNYVKYFKMKLDNCTRTDGAIGIGTKAVLYKWNLGADPTIAALSR